MMRIPQIPAVLVAVLPLWGCGAAEPPAPPPERDPVVVAALNDPLMTDLDLAAQNQRAAIVVLPGPAAAPLPLIDRNDDALAAARAAAAEVLGGAAHPAPAPGAAVPAVSGLTASATAANVLARLGLPDHCAAKLGYGFDWAARMTPLLPIYPHGHVEEAAGSDAPGCAMRVVTFLTPIPPGEVADFYWTRAAAAGFTPQRNAAGSDDLIAARRGPAAFASAIRSHGGLTEVDLVTFGL